MGYFGIGETICMSIGPMLGIFMLNKFDFNGLFSSGAIILLIAVLLILGITKNRTQEKDFSENETNKISYSLFDKKVLLQSLLIFFIGIVVSGVITYLSLFAEQQGIGNVAWFFFISAIVGIFVRVASKQGIRYFTRRDF
ncbi:MFS transporter [Lacrimispora aerotolerans]|uniref:MFS transporter n=1 Tax=Lacrimispora aerotolerans TaxID=36832 RepID=UPI00047E7E79|nr:MFS transporter [Lacrimispora aerotolerans]